MPTESEVNNFHNLMTRRFRGIRIHWENASDSYHTLDDFLIHLNSAIQEMRNITFLLQNYKSLYSDFDIWYDKKREIMKADENLKWLHEARTKVVHQKELEVSSIAKVALLNWEQLDLPELKLSPLLQDQEIIALFSQFIQTKFFIDLARVQGKPLVRVQRIWIDSEFSKTELLELLQYGYSFLCDLISEFLGMLGVSGFTTEELNLADLNLKQEFLFDISVGSYLKHSRRAIRREDIPEKIHLESERTFGAIERRSTGDIVGDMMYYHLNLNKIILTKQPELLPTCIFLDEDMDILNVRFIPFTDRAEKYSAVRELAKELQGDKSVTAILFIGEIWIVDMKNFGKHYQNPSLQTAKGEALSLSFLNKEGDVRNVIVPIYRKDGKVEFGNVQDQSWKIKDNTERSGMLLPIAEMWGLL